MHFLQWRKRVCMLCSEVAFLFIMLVTNVKAAVGSMVVECKPSTYNRNYFASLLIVTKKHSSKMVSESRCVSQKFSKMKKIKLFQSAGAVEYSECFYAEGTAPSTRVFDMTLNNLVVRFQKCWSLGECMQSTPSMPSLPGPLWTGVVAPIYGSNRTKLCTYAKIELLEKELVWHVNCTYTKLICLKWNCFVC